MSETPHPLNCICRACVDARADEVRSRREEQQRQRALHELAPVLFTLRKAKPQPGTFRAIAKRYGRSA